LAPEVSYDALIFHGNYHTNVVCLAALLNFLSFFRKKLTADLQICLKSGGFFAAVPIN